ncbi:MAG: caspase family protein, partial [Halorubrum sp.]
TALHVAKRELITGHQYIVVGDGGTTICQSRSGIAVVIDILEDKEGWKFSMRAYPNGPYGIGTMYMPSVEGISQNYVVPSNAILTDLSVEQIQNALELETVPVFRDDELCWSDEIMYI